ncbi:MAG: hypothetical protein IAE96_05005 [Chitinophagaceae bacterium]|nr:hypothetical protein [Chitinophagaceae bacterium]
MDSKIKTFEDACKALNMDPEQVLPVVSAMPEKHQKAIVSHAKLVIIAEALNEGWQPDWTDDDQWKYYPWFRMDSGSGLAYVGYGSRCSTSLVGSRLCFKTSELAEYAGNQFKELYEDYFLLR